MLILCWDIVVVAVVIVVVTLLSAVRSVLVVSVGVIVWGIV
jgi:hypothetical protein